MSSMPIEYTKNYKRERLISPNKCAKGSFRVKSVSKKNKIVVCCPKGHYNSRTKKCRVGTIGQSKLIRRK